MKNKTRHPLYTTWLGMHKRCNYPPNYHYYRGICVCDRWTGKEGFDNFVNDMGLKPTPKHSLDRIDNDGHYEPTNCRWATNYQQHLNMSRVTSTPGVRKTNDGRWHAHMMFERVIVLNEKFNTFDEAMAARMAAVKKYIGDV